MNDRNQDHWKLGVFYVNPDDPAIFVKKRFGIGYTVNFAHPKSWIVLGALLAVPVGLSVLAGLRSSR